MDTSSELANAPTQHIYRVRAGLRIGLAGGLLLICISFVLLATNALTGLSARNTAGSKAGGIITLVVLAAIFFVFCVGYVALLRMSITISPDGFAYHTMAYRLFAPWEHVAGVSDKVDSRGRHTQVLELRQPADDFESNWLLGLVKLWAAAPDQTISLQLFLTQGKEQATGLLADINQHVPRPVAPEKKKGKK